MFSDQDQLDAARVRVTFADGPIENRHQRDYDDARNIWPRYSA
jgi:hypothetical protein